MRTLVFPAVLLALAAGCDAEKQTEQTPVETPPPRTEVTPTRGPAMPVDHPETVGLDVASRGPRRLSVSQLERSLDRIANLPPGSIQIPPNLALTMGEPDYLQVTAESLDPSPLYMKFMVDLGGFYCTGIAEGDAARPAEERLMTRYGADIDQNIEHMLLMFTGIEGDGAAAYVERLRRAYDAALPGPRGQRGAYETVCIALMTSPEFILY